MGFRSTGVVPEIPNKNLDGFPYFPGLCLVLAFFPVSENPAGVWDIGGDFAEAAIFFLPIEGSWDAMCWILPYP